MKGSVRKKRKNAWSYRIDLGTVDGKRKQVEKGGFKSEREATKAMQDVLYRQILKPLPLLFREQCGVIGEIGVFLDKLFRRKAV